MKTIKLIPFEQPIGQYHIGVLKADLLLEIVDVDPRRWDPIKKTTVGGAQRPEDPKRTKEIAEYCSDPDATFPTPILVSLYDIDSTTLAGDKLTFSETEKIGVVLDGQHRLAGLRASGIADQFEVPVVFAFSLNREEQAYVFSIINSKQKPVSMSIIYDLFGLFESRSPQKTCHEIAKQMNSQAASPFYTRLKMLGKKEEALASLSQGLFVTYLMRQISADPVEDARMLKAGEDLKDDLSKPLRGYFIRKEDTVILKILMNYFNAIKRAFPEEWKDPGKYILTKTTGYGGFIRAFSPLLVDMKRDKKLTEEEFDKRMKKVRSLFEKEKLELTSAYFGSNEQEQAKLSKKILEANGL